MILRRLLTQAAVAGVWLLACPTPGQAAPSITGDSIWAAPEAAMREVQSQCGPVQSGREACYREVAARHGASPPALAAIDLLQGEGHITGFRRVGRVDLAAAIFLFRANQSAALLVVNGDPPALDVDSPTLLARMREQAHPGESFEPPVFPFPGDRFPLEAMAVETTPDKGLRLVLPYELRTCRACPTLATLSYGLVFDVAGRFTGLSFVSSSGEKTQLADRQPQARVAPGDIVLVRLPATHSTGYVWGADPLPRDGPLHLLWRAYRLTATPRPGGPGEELWWLEARKPGTATIRFRLRRAWEADPTAPERQFVVEVHPGGTR